MAVTYPFDFIVREEETHRISKDKCKELWENIQDTVNDLVQRCNQLNGRSLSRLSLVVSGDKGKPLTAENYDSNIAAIQRALNDLIRASEAQGPNPANTVTLMQRKNQETPLLIWQRDSNFRTIQTVINTLDNLYKWSRETP